MSIIKEDNNDEINFKEVFKFILRNKKTIPLITTLGLLISITYSFNTKNIWKGEFEIVLNKDNRAELSLMERLQNSNFAKLGKIEYGLIESQLKTNVEVLKSSSLLFDVFSFLKDEKMKIDPNYQSLNFKSWRDRSIKVNLKENTSVVNFSYTDENKKLIIPVLKKVVESIQNYSVTQKKSENISLAEEYFKSEINKYKKLSRNSFQEFQLFAIENDLSTTNSLKDNDERFMLSKVVPSSKFDEQRVEKANEVRLIDKLIEELENIDATSDQLKYITYLLPDFSQEKFLEIRKIDNELKSLNASYEKNDSIIKKLLISKKIAGEDLKKDIIGLLNALKTKAQLSRDALTRPGDILVKYQQLFLDATKNRLTLDELENQYRVVKLIKSHPEYQWEVITKPYLLDYPSSTSRKSILIISFLIGLIASILICLLKEKKLDIIYSINKFKSNFPFPLLAELPQKYPDKWDEIIQLLLIQVENKFNGDLSILKIGNIEINKINKINSILKKASSKKDLKVSSDFLNVANSKNLLIITEIGITKVKECEYFLNSFSLKMPSTIGFIAIN